MIEPTVGRIVLYRPHADELKHIPSPPAPGQPLAAMVAGVQSPRVINLMVSDAAGNPFSRQSVFLLQDDEAAPTDHSYAEWPHQKGQAAKTEAAEKAAAEKPPNPQQAGAEFEPGKGPLPPPDDTNPGAPGSGSNGVSGEPQPVHEAPTPPAE